MPRKGPSYITIEGDFARDVLGSFSIIRGFATLQQLAEISAPYYLTDGTDGGVVGHQRPPDEDHATEIKNYFEKGDKQFIPEIILSLRVAAQPEMIGTEQVGISYRDPTSRISVGRKTKSRKLRGHYVRVMCNKLDEIHQQLLIRRIDGNHRLAKAAELKIDSGRQNKYLVPFCLIVLAPPGDQNDDYAESLIFHSINSTARPLESEHALQLILRQPKNIRMTEAQEFAFSPPLHFTRLLHDKLQALPADLRHLLGERSLARLAIAAKEMLRTYPDRKKSAAELTRFADELVGVLVRMANKLTAEYADFVAAEYFPELTSHVWMKTADQADAKRNGITEARLTNMARWLGGDGLRRLNTKEPLGRQLIQIHDTIIERTPKRVFLARWYPEAKYGEALALANARLVQVRASVERASAEMGQRLELKDLGTEAEPVRLIHPEMFGAIKTADIIIADLSGLRPNVFAEAGFALQHMNQGRLVFLFQPSEQHQKVPFDLAPYNRVEVNDSGQIPTALTPILKAIMEKAGRGEI